MSPRGIQKINQRRNSYVPLASRALILDAVTNSEMHIRYRRRFTFLSGIAHRALEGYEWWKADPSVENTAFCSEALDQLNTVITMPAAELGMPASDLCPTLRILHKQAIAMSSIQHNDVRTAARNYRLSDLKDLIAQQPGHFPSGADGDTVASCHIQIINISTF